MVNYVFSPQCYFFTLKVFYFYHFVLKSFNFNDLSCPPPALTLGLPTNTAHSSPALSVWFLLQCHIRIIMFPIPFSRNATNKPLPNTLSSPHCMHNLYIQKITFCTLLPAHLYIIIDFYA